MIVDPSYQGNYYQQIKLKSGFNLITVTVDANSLAFGYIPNKAGTVKISDGISSTEFTWTKDTGDGISWEYDPPSNSWAPSGSYYGSSPGYDNQDAPTAKITPPKYLYGKAPYTINFQSESFDPEGTQLTYEWDFNDGKISQTANPTHTFLKAGSYEVVLYVWDLLGLSDSDAFELVVFPSDVIISEIFPNPPGLDEGQEFVELYNRGKQTINLNGWQIKDNSGGGITLVKEKIKPKSYRIFSGNFYLNNSSSDSVNLYYPGGRLRADSLNYQTAQSGFSLALLNGKYQWTYQPTPGKKNIFAKAPVYIAQKYYSTSYQNYQTSYSNSKYLSQVKGIMLKATDDSLYPIGQDFRSKNIAEAGLFSVQKRWRFLVFLISFVGLIFLIIYPKIFRQRIRGP